MTIAPAPPKSWETSLLRATAFYSAQLELGAVNWWETLTGKPADSKMVRAGMGQLVEQGTVDDKSLLLQIQPGRIDWVLVPKEDPEREKFPSLEDFEKASIYFRELATKWLEHAPPLSRLAFGAVVAIPTGNESESVQTISSFLPNIKIDWSEIRDFTFQANRPQPCLTLPQLGLLNRLVKWQTVVRKGFTMTIAPQPQPALTTMEEPAAQCELDISTAAATMPLPPQCLGKLFTELVQNAADILSKGGAL